MRQGSPVPRPAPDNADDILGQFFCAFGQGAGSMRIQRSAIAAFRRRYLGPIQSAPGPWKAVSANVLSFVAQVGRFAALLATQAGRTAITGEDFMHARRAVEHTVHGRADELGIFIAGPHCTEWPEDAPAVSGSTPQDVVLPPMPAADSADLQPSRNEATH